MVAAYGELSADPSQLRALVASLRAELYAKSLQIEQLKAQLAALRRARFGRSSEKLDREIEQLELLIEEMQAKPASPENDVMAETDEPVSSCDAPPTTPQKLAAPRRSLPDHLPRERVEHAPASSCPSCGSEKLSCMGTDEREVLEYVPSHFKVIVHARPKMSCRSCETITQASMPSLPIERGLPGPGLLARVVVGKYADHLPLYRQSAIYARSGVEIERSTLADWVGRTAYLLTPLAEAVADHVRASQTIHADDTPVPVLDPGRGKTRTGRLWVAVRDERPWGSGVPPGVFYRYAPDRRAERAQELLRGCQGYLHADGYAGYKPLYREGDDGAAPLMEVACWAHARRKIYDVHVATKSPAAHDHLRRISELFAIEDEIRGAEPEHRRTVRADRAVPVLADLRREFEATLARISAKSSLAGALRYALARWDALVRYTEDGRLDICNNAAERAIRPLAVGRKNWLFAGSDTGGEHAAIIYTLIETAKLNGLDPEAYMKHVITHIADHPMKRLDELLPWNLPSLQSDKSDASHPLDRVHNL